MRVVHGLGLDRLVHFAAAHYAVRLGIMLHRARRSFHGVPTQIKSKFGDPFEVLD
jgi:hypothetical protein